MALFDSREGAQAFLHQEPTLASVRHVGAEMSQADRMLLVDQVLRLVRDYYVHLPLKTSSLAIDPVQELTLLLDDVPYIDSQAAFHARLLATVKKLRDRHTSIQLPPPLSEAVAFLPFAVESFWEGRRRPLIVTKLLATLDDPAFVPGVEITHWNGVPIGRYIERMAWDNEGANPYARVAIALRSLTVRPLAFSQPPDEDWVVVTYVSNGQFRSVTLPWRVYFPPAGSAVRQSRREADAGDVTAKGLDRASHLVNSSWNDLFAGADGQPPQGVFLEPDPAQGVPDILKNHAYFTQVRFGTSVYGYVRIFSFDTADNRPFVEAFATGLAAMPAAGLIIDARGNPGGTIPVGEAILQMLTTRPIHAEKLAFRVTTPLQKLVRSSPLFGPWQRSLGIRYETGQIFSQGFSLYDPRLAEGLAGIYPNPVVLIIDALSYSTSDFFAAGFQDNALGPIIGTDPISGAGGANVWTHRLLMHKANEAGDASLAPMPEGIDMTVALRRSSRVGFNDEIPVEGLGVSAEFIHQLTRQDVLGKNEDLITFAGYILSQVPRVR